MSGYTSLKGGRVSYAAKKKDMAAYDALPRSVRIALANAAFDWAAYSIHWNFERDIYDTKTILWLIATSDKLQIAQDRSRVWGVPPEHPPIRKARRRR